MGITNLKIWGSLILLCLFLGNALGCGADESVKQDGHQANTADQAAYKGPLIGLNNDTPTPCKRASARKGKLKNQIVFTVECDPTARQPVVSSFSIAAETSPDKSTPYPRRVAIASFSRMLTVGSAKTASINASCDRDPSGRLLVCGTKSDEKVVLLGWLRLARRNQCSVYVSVVARANLKANVALRQRFDGRPRGCESAAK